MRRFFAISASVFLVGGLFLGCTAKKSDDNPNVKVDPPIASNDAGSPNKDKPNENPKILPAGNVDAGQAGEAKPLTAKQEQRLAERDQLLQNLEKLLVQDRPEEAIAAFGKPLAIQREIFGESHAEVAEALQFLAGIHLYAQNYEMARAELKRAQDIYQNLGKKGSYGVAEMTYRLGHVNAVAKMDAKKQQQVRAATLDNWKANVEYRNGRFQEGLALAQRALAQRRELYGLEHLDVANSLNSLSGIQTALGDLSAAQTAGEQALKIFQAILGESHPLTANAGNSLGGVDRLLGRYAEARWRFESALAVASQTVGDADRFTLSVQNNLGLLLLELGDYAGAERHLTPVLVIQLARKSDFNRNELYLAFTNMGHLFQARGDYARARQMLDSALAAIKNADNVPRFVEANSNLGVLLQLQGDTPKARNHYEIALDASIKGLGERHPTTMIVMNNLGHLLLEQGKEGDLKDARRWFEHVIDVQTELKRTSQPAHAVALNNLAVVLLKLKEFPAAQEALDKSLEIIKTQSGENHPDYARALGNLAMVLEARGQFDAAQKKLEQALQICRDAAGEVHPQTALWLSNLGLFHLTRAEDAKARTYLERSLESQLKVTQNLLGTLAEAEGLAYVEAALYGRDPVLSVLRRLPNAKPEDAYSAVWKTRGLATRALISRRNIAGADPKAQELWKELRIVRLRIAQLTLTIALPGDSQSRQEKLSVLIDEKEKLERRLADLSQSFKKDQEIQQVNFTQLAGKLASSTAFVDVVRMQLLEPDPKAANGLKMTPQYDAFVLRSSDKAPGYTLSWVRLGLADPIDKAVADWRKSITGKQAAVGAPDQVLRKLVWEPIEKHLDGCTTVVLVPDGSLTRLPWAALPGNNPNTYLVQKYAFGVVMNGQHLYDLVTHAEPEGGGVLAVGGVDYGFDPLIKGGGFFQKLPGTAIEADSVAELAAPRRVTLLKGHAADEKDVIEKMPSARYVHLATHGFFADAGIRTLFDTDKALKVNNFMLIGKQSTTGTRNPLTLSGVALADANLHIVYNPRQAATHYNGWMTGEKIANLDLSGTELVVLSACETGLGEIIGGEGVFGVQRAFGLAGARAVIGSLWEVPDQETMQMMKDFYKNLWKQKLGRLEALRQAQLGVLNSVQKDPRLNRLPKDRLTELWAAWILSGHPGDQKAFVSRVKWSHGNGQFVYQSGKKWVETDRQGGRADFAEVTRNDDFIELYDKSRDIAVRLYAMEMTLRQPGEKEFKHFYDGKWLE